MAADERFETLDRRIDNHEDCREAVADRLATRTVAELVEQLRAVGVPVAPINDTQTVWENPQVQAREMLRSSGYDDETIDRLVDISVLDDFAP